MLTVKVCGPARLHGHGVHLSKPVAVRTAEGGASGHAGAAQLQVRVGSCRIFTSTESCKNKKEPTSGLVRARSGTLGAHQRLAWPQAHSGDAASNAAARAQLRVIGVEARHHAGGRGQQHAVRGRAGAHPHLVRCERKVGCL